MRERLEAAIDWLERRSLRAQLLAVLLDGVVLDTLNTLTWSPKPGYGLSGPDREAIRRALRDEHARLWSMTYDQLLDLEPQGAWTPIAVPNGLPVVLVVEVFAAEGTATVQMRVDVDGPEFCGLGCGPAFVIDQDGTRKPDDGWWEADWR